MKYIDAEKLIAKVKELNLATKTYEEQVTFNNALAMVVEIIDTLQQETPDKETILRICKLHKAWSIIAPWENIEDFVMTNWNSENIV